jgi:DNA (cytosine-5)-methyltransferase 1
MRVLDLFCKGGGCSVGYHRAGFEVEGVDIELQPHYPFKFQQMDALEFLDTQDLSRFDLIHASPPCQKFSQLQYLGAARNGSYKEHVDLVQPIRERLKRIGKPYVIENVVGAPLLNSVVLCGSMFGLKVYRHRCFETSMFLWAPEHVPHDDKTPSAGQGISPKGFISVCGTGGVRGFNKDRPVLDYWKMAMGIDWMDRAELAQAIPPAYTEWIGQQILSREGVYA